MVNGCDAERIACELMTAVQTQFYQLIDEKQLATARYSGVSARSELFLEAVNLEFVTGNLLRTQPKATVTGTGGSVTVNPATDGKTQ